MNYNSLALASALFAAVANLLAQRLSGQTKVRDIVPITFLTMTGILAFGAPWFYHFTITPYTISLLLIITGLDVISNIFYFKSFEHASASTVTPLLSLSPVVTFILGWVLLGDGVAWYTYVISGLIVVGIIIFSIDFSQRQLFNKQILWPTLLAASLFGASAIPTKMLFNEPGVTNGPTLYLLRAGLIGLITFILFRPKLVDLTLKKYSLITIRSIMVIICWLLWYTALAHGHVGVAATLNNTSPIFVFLLSVVFLKEKVQLRKLLAAGFVLLLAVVLFVV